MALQLLNLDRSAVLANGRRVRVGDALLVGGHLANLENVLETLESDGDDLVVVHAEEVAAKKGAKKKKGEESEEDKEHPKSGKRKSNGKNKGVKKARRNDQGDRGS